MPTAVKETPEQTIPKDSARPEARRVSRRTLIRMGTLATLGLLAIEAIVGFISFYTPRKFGVFGSKVPLGKPGQFALASITTFVEAKLFMSHVPEGFLAMYWKCPHLGCTVQWHPEEPTEDKLAPMGRFHCPCHGSIYDRYGQIISGPAPRPLDLFKLTLVNGNFIADTSDITQRKHWEPNQVTKG
ncbi:MAG TPA: ubiquinol-cytochrome c reductase iron-sulfur subunit [Chloroflexota bacterium]|nr:ubiquinol-cytochrome c reductase iron-sulfur subunit [Chloroflexota bacterium]